MEIEKHILYFSYSLDSEGAPHQAMGALFLARQGVQIRFIAWGNKTEPDWLAGYPNIKYKLLPKQGLFSAVRVLIAFFREFFRNRPDYVYVQGAQQTPFLLWLPFFKGKAKLIYHTQDYLGPGQHWFYETCERFFARRADWVISNEPNRARFMASSYRLRRMPEVIRTALPTWWPVPERDDVYRQNLLERAGLVDVHEPRLIVAGGGYRTDRMSPQLLEAFSELPANYALVFSWMTSGSVIRLACEAHLERLGLKERVVFLDSLEFRNLLSLYACCDIGMLLYPNNGVGHFYQAPGRLTEYLRCGLLLVCSAFPGLELLTLKNKLGAVADPYSPSAIANAIQSIGSMSNDDLEASKEAVKQLANTGLVYETQAEPVFTKILDEEREGL